MSVITIHYVVSWFGVFLKCMRRPSVRVLACQSARGKLLNSEGLNWRRNFSFSFREPPQVFVCLSAPVFGLPVCACIFCSTWGVVTLHQWRRGGAACVPRLSMEHLRDQIIAVSSASLPAWESHHIIIRLLQLSDENTKLVSSGSVIKQKTFIGNRTALKDTGVVTVLVPLGSQYYALVNLFILINHFWHVDPEFICFLLSENNTQQFQTFFFCNKFVSPYN